MRKPRIGLALGAGGARGFAHVGVLQVLEKMGIEIASIAGSSMGSMVGAFYCNGMDTKYLEQLAVNLKRRHWIDFTVPKMGFVNGTRIMEMVRFLTKGQNIEDLRVPLAIVATDVERGERVVFREGPIDQAVRASISIPGIFIPHRYQGRLLIDGGVIDRVPIHVAREMGADIVIAVDVGLFDRETQVKSIFDVIFQSIEIMEREILRSRMLDADLVIRPDVGHISSTAFTQIDEAVRLGREATERVAELIRSTIDDWKEGAYSDVTTS
ncbi:patatin-like phospholipase family protein [Tumebacillus flagellatus]|uniref:Esterase n=1 Tax=Tumebacillus flagellatus TaxID=1157490 RepID=A0A074LI89_9BACL|nr:patatin-like phospholipase family protein [Tumebacillus flagellatus]KEO81936.1 esterase [Tumebacillus flagellatus]